MLKLDHDPNPNKNQIFSNDINHELADIAHYQRLIQNKQQRVEKFLAIQEKTNIVLGLAEEVAEEIRDTDERYLETFRASLDDIILNSSSTIPDYLPHQHTEASSIDDNIQKDESKEVNSVKPSSIAPADNNSEAICSPQNSFSATTTSAEEITEIPPEENNNPDPEDNDPEGGAKITTNSPKPSDDDGDGTALTIEPTSNNSTAKNTDSETINQINDYNHRVKLFHHFNEKGLTSTELASRLDIPVDTLSLSSKKDKISEFAKWTEWLDPDGLEWGKRDKNSNFFPCNPRTEIPAWEKDPVQKLQPTDKKEATPTTPTEPIDWSNNYIDWCQTENPHLAYFKTKHNNEVKAVFIGANNKTKLKTWETHLKSLVPGVTFEIRSNSKDMRLPQFKHELKIWGLKESDICNQLVNLDFSIDSKKFLESINSTKSVTPIQEQTSVSQKINIDTESDSSPKENNTSPTTDFSAPTIDEKELPTGCYLTRSDDWDIIVYYVYVYVRKFDHDLKGFVIDTKKVGRLIQCENHIAAMRGHAFDGRDFNSTIDGVNYLLWVNGITRQEIAEAYFEKFPPEIEFVADNPAEKNEPAAATEEVDPFGGFPF